MQIPLRDGDRVVAAFQFRDYVLVITETGMVFKIKVSNDPFDTRLWLVEAG